MYYWTSQDIYKINNTDAYLWNNKYVIERGKTLQNK
jgi:hypothetical protein